ncbi:MAG: acetyl-CoA carboxylase biotin carboxyl carrier protein, partial [Vicinamibacterales bacterium]
DQLKRILDLVREHELSEFEVEHDGLRVRVRRDALPRLTADPLAPAAPAPAAIGAVPAPAAALEPEGDELQLAVVKSPIVGTFYQSAEPGAAPVVSVGSPVKKGQVLCISEAMKLMNEIDSEYEGEVVAVYVENGQAVQYGERLFAIKPS